MFSFAKLTVLSLSLSPAFSLVVPRFAPPPVWTTDLEPYDTYHTRYLALSCHTKHDTTFFDQCCHPLLRNESLGSRQAHCTPSPQTSSLPAEDDLDECDDDDDDNQDDASRHALLSSRSLVEESRVVPAAPKNNSSPQLDTSVSIAKNKQLKSSSPSEKNTATDYKGGYATYYYQHGVAGACGQVHADTDLIAAIDGDRYGDLGAVSSLCGKKVKITNDDSHKSVTVTIADACPTCRNSNSIDLSEIAFKRIASLDQGIVPISWTFL